MFQIIKLYSSDNFFKAINFKNGINLICGERSISPDGEVESDKQNGVGKSLTIELINFCLFKRSNESRVIDIPEEHLPERSFVNLHIKVNDIDIIISRNKKNEIKMKIGSSGFQNYEFEDAKKELTRLLKFEDQLLTARDYFNFMIKEEDYSYKDFAKLYHSSYADLLKIHFYFFGFPLRALINIKNAFIKNSEATAQSRQIKRDLENKNLDIEEIKALNNQIKADIEVAEKNLDYQELTEKIEQDADDISKNENELNGLILKRKSLKFQLAEINDFAKNYNDDFYIDDDEIGKVFEKYKAGLGDLITKDINELRGFRDQIIEFKDQLLQEKRKNLNDEISKLNQNIGDLKLYIDSKFANITSQKSSNFSKGLSIYKQKYSDLQKYSSYISEFEKHEKKREETRTIFNEEIEILKLIEIKIDKIKTSFQETFIQVHNKIMGNYQFSFDFSLKSTFLVESFFKFSISGHGNGSKGVNQMVAVIYDISLLLNDFTKDKHLKCIVHDNLIFGSVDKDSSINTLNFLNNLDAEGFQYIATVNKDDFSYSELESKFSFKTREMVVVELTKINPLFPNWK